MRILYVDDHIGATSMMEEIFSDMGHIADTATSVQIAKRLCQSNEYELAIVDLCSPDGDGLHMLQSVCADGKTQGMIISDSGSGADIRRTREAGFDVHLIKPFTKDQIEAAIGRFEERSRDTAVRWVAVQAFMER